MIIIIAYFHKIRELMRSLVKQDSYITVVINKRLTHQIRLFGFEAVRQRQNG